MITRDTHLFGPRIPTEVEQLVLDYCWTENGTFEKPKERFDQGRIVAVKGTQTRREPTHFFQIVEIVDRAARGQEQFRRWEAQPQFPLTHLTAQGRENHQAEARLRATQWYLRDGTIYRLTRINDGQSFEYDTETFELRKVGGGSSIPLPGYELRLL